MAIGISYSWDVSNEQHKELLVSRGNKMDRIDIVVRNVGDEVLVRTFMKARVPFEEI